MTRYDGLVEVEVAEAAILLALFDCVWWHWLVTMCRRGG